MNEREVVVYKSRSLGPTRLSTIWKVQDPGAGRCDGALTDEQLEAILRARLAAASKVAKGGR